MQHGHRLAAVCLTVGLAAAGLVPCAGCATGGLEQPMGAAITGVAWLAAVAAWLVTALWAAWTVERSCGAVAGLLVVLLSFVGLGWTVPAFLHRRA